MGVAGRAVSSAEGAGGGAGAGEPGPQRAEGATHAGELRTAAPGKYYVTGVIIRYVIKKKKKLFSVAFVIDVFSDTGSDVT